MSKVEDYIKEFTNNCSNERGGWIEGNYEISYKPWLTPDHARAVAAIAREETIENLWKDAQGDDLPEINREVIALVQDWDDAGIYTVVFAHRPDPKGWDGKSLSTGEVSHYEPKTYNKGGWNLPEVKYWLDLDLPFKEE